MTNLLRGINHQGFVCKNVVIVPGKIRDNSKL